MDWLGCQPPIKRDGEMPSIHHLLWTHITPKTHVTNLDWSWTQSEVFFINGSRCISV